ncbi:MAG: histidine phosphatase family protein [Alphaproteobacteria bacterium]|nr:histidine phosphatase family protein [Alphaproteobacteria bacterium]MBV9541267.1 histidine phosphatase family protein [Alphaproteobacteria bacterium]MBV9904572.1 histidine phosphatase family protein [Alphaproteobacteria bacterium]
MSDFRDLTLYVVRHGETEDNVSQTITAQADSPLTARGRAQGAAKGPILRALADDLATLAFIASPLHRACVTMELMRQGAGLSAVPYATDHRLQEMNFGDWTKLPEGEDRRVKGGPTAHTEWSLACPNGESEAMVHDRVGRFLQTLARDCVIVTHARVIAMIRSHVLDLSPAQTMEYEPSNAGVLRLAHGTEAFFSA